MVTLKFGGTSVADAPALKRLCAIVARERRNRVVVVSALSGVTDALLEVTRAAERGAGPAAADGIRHIRERHERLAEEVTDAATRRQLLADLEEYWADLDALARAVSILRSAPPASRDAIAARGELASSRLVTAALQARGVPAIWVDARSVVATDARHERAVPLGGETAARAGHHVAPLIAQGLVPVVGGFVGSTLDGVTTTLGRGGSDFSASLVGASLGASEIQIWTDTDGVLTADPRVVAGAETVDSLSFREASALAHFGAKVLHPATMAPAIDDGIPVRILNSRRPDHPGTLVTGRAAARRNPLAGLACVADIVGLDIALPPDANRERVLAQVFEACAAHGATVYLSTVGDAHVSIAIGPSAAAGPVAAACQDGGTVQLRDGQALLVAVGDGLVDGRAQARDVLRALTDVTVHEVSESARGGYVAVAIPRSGLARAMAELHDRFFGARLASEAPVVSPAVHRRRMTAGLSNATSRSL